MNIILTTLIFDTWLVHKNVNSMFQGTYGLYNGVYKNIIYHILLPNVYNCQPITLYKKNTL